MRDLKMTPRNYMYRLLSNFFARELTVENIESIRDGETARLMNALKETVSYAPFIQHLEAYFVKNTDAAQVSLDLAESYAWLFHGVASPLDAPLTASVYLSQNGVTFQEPEMALHERMHHYGISYVKDANEPCDHLSVILEFVSWLGEKAEIAGERDVYMEEQKQIIEKYLLSWLPDFAARCKKGDILGFYASLAQDTLDFVIEDSRQLMCASCKQ